VQAEQNEVLTFAFPEEYGEMLKGLPKAVSDSLPERIFTSDPQEAADAWQALLSPRALLSLVWDRLRAQGNDLLSLLLGLCGVMLLRGAIGNMAASLRSPILGEGIRLLIRVVLFGLIVG
jgi:hypothetical protein